MAGEETGKDCPVCGGSQEARTWDEAKECSRLHLMGRAASALERIASALERQVPPPRERCRKGVCSCTREEREHSGGKCVMFPDYPRMDLHLRRLAIAVLDPNAGVHFPERAKDLARYVEKLFTERDKK